MTPIWQHSEKRRRLPAGQVTEQRPQAPTVVALAGMPGAGKSTLAAALASALDLRLADLDEEIAVREGASVAEIFRRQGEGGFRDREVAELARLLSRPDRTPLVIALGGGTGVADRRSAELLRGRARVIYLWCTPAHLLVALQDEQERRKRPLLAEGDMKERLERLYGERHPRYLELADLVLGPDLPWEDLRVRALTELREWFGAIGSAAGEVS